MVLKALEAIKEAESKAAAMKEEVLAQIKDYESKKNTEILNQTNLVMEENAAKLAQLHTKLQEEYDQKKATAQEETQKEMETMNQQFASQKEELISFIVGKVRENYGG